MAMACRGLVFFVFFSGDQRFPICTFCPWPCLFRTGQGHGKTTNTIINKKNWTIWRSENMGKKKQTCNFTFLWMTNGGMVFLHQQISGGLKLQTFSDIRQKWCLANDWEWHEPWKSLWPEHPEPNHQPEAGSKFHMFFEHVTNIRRSGFWFFGEPTAHEKSEELILWDALLYLDSREIL